MILTHQQNRRMKMGKRCHLWFCWRKSAGYIEIGFPGTQYFEKIPYCQKHGNTAQEIIDNNNITFVGKGKAKFEPRPTEKDNQ